MIAKMVLKTYPERPTQVVFDAAVEAVKSLGHEVEGVNPRDDHPEVKFRAIVGGRRDRKEWSVSVTTHQSGVTIATVSRWAFVGGSQSKVNAVGQDIFRSMDTILA